MRSIVWGFLEAGVGAQIIAKFGRGKAESFATSTECTEMAITGQKRLKNVSPVLSSGLNLHFSAGALSNSQSIFCTFTLAASTP
eukprot:1154686-Pelagomonas_calceolata.AAC.4